MISDMNSCKPEALPCCPSCAPCDPFKLGPAQPPTENIYNGRIKPDYPPIPSKVVKVCAKMAEEIKASENPKETKMGIMLTLLAYIKFFGHAMNYLAYEVNIDENQPAKPEDETREDVREYDQEGDRKSNPRGKAGSDEGNSFFY